jgi:pre-mRNA-splicing helicase BRR2
MAQAIKDNALANENLNRFVREDSARIDSWERIVHVVEVLQTQIELMKSNDLKHLLSYGFANIVNWSSTC